MAARPNAFVSHLVTGLDSTACKMKIPIEETKEWDLSFSGKVGYGMLKLACRNFEGWTLEPCNA